MTAGQRNARRGVRGFSPAALMLGSRRPRMLGAPCDEDFGLARQSALSDPKSGARELTVRRAAAAAAFIEANCSRAARASLLARSRPTRRRCEIGERVYYWRPENDKRLEKRRWRGPALVVAAEAQGNEGDMLRAAVVWVAHGRAIY